MSDPELRRTLAELLRQSRAHTGLKRALEGFPVELAGRTVDEHRHTAWQQVEHLRLAAEDLVSYCLDSDYQDLGWPDGYWPDSAEPPDDDAWHDSVDKLLTATVAMAELVENEGHDLFGRVPSAEKASHHTLRAALILLDHNSYHAGQLIALRIALNAWPPA